jgi:hypothetical protein
MSDFRTVHKLAAAARQPGSLRASQGPSQDSLLRVGAEILRLLSHYWSTNENEALREAQARDWLADLKDFSPEIVAEACGNWRRGETKRPMISDIRQRCFEILDRSRPPEPAYRADGDLTARVKAEWCGKFADAARYREVWARSRGYEDFAAAVASGALGRRGL